MSDANVDRSKDESPKGTYRCDICGKDFPHHHSELEVEIGRFARPAFEAIHTRTPEDSDGHVRSIPPLSMGEGPAKRYWPDRLQAAWIAYSDGWADCMKSRKERKL